jgi:DNA-binding transcriptional ArsR family regulator
MNTNNLEKIYKALGNRRRLDILRFLSQNEAATVFDIAEKIHLSFRSTSKHLQILKQVGFLENEQVRFAQHYHLAEDKSQILKQALALL